jgi:hypothetical protein
MVVHDQDRRSHHPILAGRLTDTHPGWHASRGTQRDAARASSDRRSVDHLPLAPANHGLRVSVSQPGPSLTRVRKAHTRNPWGATDQLFGRARRRCGRRRRPDPPSWIASPVATLTTLSPPRSVIGVPRFCSTPPGAPIEATERRPGGPRGGPHKSAFADVDRPRRVDQIGPIGAAGLGA